MSKQDDLTAAERVVCMECGMPCKPNEYHPFLACLAFKQCHDSETVRANMDAVRQQTRQEAMREAKGIITQAATWTPQSVVAILDRLAREGREG